MIIILSAFCGIFVAFILYVLMIAINNKILLGFFMVIGLIAFIFLNVFLMGHYKDQGFGLGEVKQKSFGIIYPGLLSGGIVFYLLFKRMKLHKQE